MNASTGPRLSFLLFTFPQLFTRLVTALPLPRSAPISIDSGQDAWAEALSGVGPLILLIGEKNTKQLLREARGIASILSMSFAPIGLLSVLTSMIRLCGSQKLRSYLGYEHEPRANAALETTGVNCGGVYAEVVDGFISRKTGADAQSRALAVALLEGEDEETIREALDQMQACCAFQDEKMKRGCREDAGTVNWCFRLLCSIDNDPAHGVVANIIAEAMRIADSSKVLKVFTRKESSPSKLISLIPSMQIETADQGDKSQSKKMSATMNVLELSETQEPKTAALSSTLLRPNVSKAQEHRWRHLPKPFRVSFMCTFDGVSELNASRSTHKLWSLTIAISSLLAMMAIQFLSLWQEHWNTSGMVMVMVGYLCMAGGVSVAAYLIYSSCSSARMVMQKGSATAKWTHGLVMDVKTADSMDTAGSRLMQANNKELLFEAVWLREPSAIRLVLSWLTALFLTLSFVCYYLGLRSVKWWVGVGQLLVCLLAAFLRSMTKMEWEKFQVTDDVRLDKRCFSTGIVDVQRPSRIKKEDRLSDKLDLRIHSLQISGCKPLTGESIAWRAAKLCNSPDFANAGNAILSLTGLTLSILPTTSVNERKVIVTFKGGIITEQGLAFPNAMLCLAFPTLIADLAAPTPLIARAIMRQAQWSLENEEIRKETLPFLGGMYISSFDSLITWWTIAEDRNDMADQHKNLHGSFILICTAFFLALLRGCGDDESLMETIVETQAESGNENEGYAENLVKFLGSKLG